MQRRTYFVQFLPVLLVVSVLAGATTAQDGSSPRPTLAMLSAGSARPHGAQQRCDGASTRVRFEAYFRHLEGAWNVTIRDFEASGALSYTSEQEREFAWVVGGRYIEEKAYTRQATGARTNIGLMLYSFDDVSAQVRLISFWPRSPRRWAEFVGCASAVTDRLTGTITSYRPNEPERTRRIELVLESPVRLRWRGFARGPDGSEYVAEELEYVRAAARP